MWKESVIKMGDITGAMQCSILPVHPWIYGVGQQTKNGRYLSPANAVSYLSGQLSSAAGRTDVVVFLITGSGHDEFMQNLDGLIGVLPFPAITQVRRLARSAFELESEKMLIPSPLAVMPAPASLSTPTTRAAINAQAVEAARQAAGAGASLDGMKSALEGFISQRAQLLNDMASRLEALKGKSAQAWTFVASGDVATTLAGLARDIPAASAVHCAAVMLVGEDLQGIRSLIHDIDPDTGA